MKLLFAATLLAAGLNATAQNIIPFNSSRWSISGKEAVTDTFNGKPCLKMVNGAALLKDAGFTNGVIEFDMAVAKARYFPGIAFRMQDSMNGEAFYVRPHQSGNPDAMQYYPEYNGAGGWQLYYGDGFGNPHAIPLERWVHVKFLIKDTAAEVYFDDEKQPVLFIKKLYRPVQSGMIALTNEWDAPVFYANFSYTATNNVTLQSKPKPAGPLPVNVLTRWQVSAPFDEALLAGKPSLADIPVNNPGWQTVVADERGVVNLDQLAALGRGKNTVFAKLVIHSDKQAFKKLSFGFSDRALVYFNGKLLYAGHDEFI
ncbi:MAG TPA: hypothetical protein VHB48_18110 [Chitinophagaceae bacterium]|nr:hypothetical protein [Chitinophagaceae bacterium]